MQLNNLRMHDASTLLQRWRPALDRRLPLLASMVLGLAIAWVLAELTWSLLPRPKIATPIYKHAATLAATPTDGELANLHLFGTPVAGTAVSAPATNLNLTLRGIAAGGNAHSPSFAIIASGGVGKVYAVGAQVPGGAKIRSIFPDHVLLDLNGRLQSLRLPETQSSSTGEPAATPAPSPPVPKAVYGRTLPAAQNLNQLRNEIVKHPERLLDMMRAMPVMQDGKLEGYRVFPVGNSNAFSQLGLQPGDIVTAVNGVALDNPAQSMKVLNNIRTSSQVSVTFMRNGQQQTKILQFNNHGNPQR